MLDVLIGAKFSRVPMATFLNHIADVLFLSTKKKMARIDAGRIIATMTNEFSFWDFTFMDLVGNSVGGILLSDVREFSIPTISKAPSPYPARGGFLHVSPKLCFNGFYP
jgi:hypothetical protein